jgi:hypothetical protein
MPHKASVSWLNERLKALTLNDMADTAVHDHGNDPFASHGGVELNGFSALHVGTDEKNEFAPVGEQADFPPFGEENEWQTAGADAADEFPPITTESAEGGGKLYENMVLFISF